MLPTILLLCGMFAAVSLAKDPQSQTPGLVKNNTLNTSNDQCDTTTVGVIRGGQVQVTDCFDIMDSSGTANFSVEMSDWRDSTDLSDEYYKLFTVGSCELAVKRIDGGKSTTWIGKFDIHSIINQSVELAKTGGGDQLETTHGEMNCTSKGSPKALISWTLRQASNDTGNGNVKPETLLGWDEGGSKTAT
ncbi:hypothetical protein INS49_011096 [Diaporthe citri]|uniref:uncharacterized protein n=1 Tax=Diaporthe citri TaxID=83186 RepID=UPI001C80C329|nr:uncharacterized protein INS49_011096 [Diaporthe citri]KAG6360040.1 hypothetical protein INS49_011096 [Diaporthe citri]